VAGEAGDESHNEMKSGDNGGLPLIGKQRWGGGQMALLRLLIAGEQRANWGEWQMLARGRIANSALGARARAASRGG
jgi:hypothetical protein